MESVCANEANRVVDLVRVDHLAVRVKATWLEAAKRKPDSRWIGRQLILEYALRRPTTMSIRITLLPVRIAFLPTHARVVVMVALLFGRSNGKRAVDGAAPCCSCSHAGARAEG